ncbi:MAG: AtpZ/AtpI family protein [Thermomicrobiales bacterium]
MQFPPSPVDNDDARAAGVAAGLGCSIVVSIIFCIVGGILLDEWLDTSPWLTLIGVALGLFAAGYQLYELAMLGQKDRQPKVITRQIAKVANRKKLGPTSQKS